jgi:hypothetical protein
MGWIKTKTISALRLFGRSLKSGNKLHCVWSLTCLTAGRAGGTFGERQYAPPGQTGTSRPGWVAPPPEEEQQQEDSGIDFL